MWWHNVIGSIPFLLIIFMLLRHIGLERSAHSKERSEMISRILLQPVPASQPDQSFIPLDDPRIAGMMEHLTAQSTVQDVEGSEGQPHG